MGENGGLLHFDQEGSRPGLGSGLQCVLAGKDELGQSSCLSGNVV